jgi:two-component system, cell cycle sensor histidine kinase and response regulator CckA
MSIPDEEKPIPLFEAAGLPSGDPKQRESEVQFKEMMAHLGQVFWMRNAADTAVLYISPAYEKIWGRTCASLYDNSHTILDSIHPDDHARMAEVMAKKQETGGYDEEYRIVRPDGTIRWIWARAYPVRDEQGEIKRYAGIAEDVSERKWAEKERSRLAAIIEHTEDAIMSITLDGIIIAWNHGAERKYGYTAEEIIGRSIFILIPPDHSEEYLEVMKKVRNGQAVQPYDTVRKRKDGTLIDVSVGISLIESRDGEIVGVSKTGHDISRVRKLEAQLIEAQKMEVLGHLTGGIAHDFNNILAVVLGYSELMLEGFAPDDPLRQPVSDILCAAERGAGLTRQLLVFSRKEIVRPTVLNLTKVVKDMEGMLRQLLNEGIDLILAHGMRVGQIKADLGYVGQVVMNLVVNARDAMPGGGTLTIDTNDVTLDATYAANNPDVACGEYVMLSISDTGVGMSDETKAHAFEAFFTTKPKGKGTGLGLATCQTIVQQSGGHIDLCSEAGKGTTFKIYFPRVSELPESATRQIQSGPLPRGTETILVVEDDPDVRHLVCTVLKAQGYEVLSSVNGQDGLRTVLENKEPAISLVVTDVVMPHMGGKEMAGWLETTRPDLKILFTSGYTDDALAQHGLVGLQIAVLSKPYSIATLARKVRELLDARPIQTSP